MKKKALALFLAALLAASAASCGKKTEPDTTPDEPSSSGDITETPVSPPETDLSPDVPNIPTPNPNAGITLGDTEIEMMVGDTYQITPTYIPEYDTDSKTMAYTASDAGILSVTADGLVTALAAGSATVTVTNESGKYSAVLNITVSEEVIPPVEDNPKPNKTQFLTVFESALYQGNLVLVNPAHGTPAASADSIISIRQNTTASHLKVSQYKFEVSAETLAALSALVNDYYATLSQTITPKDVLVSDAHRTPEDQQDKIDSKEDATPVGHSDFQTGLSVNLKLYDGTFTHFIGDGTVTAETAWLLKNYASYGFILRYPDGKDAETGYNASNSHFRYVGVPHAVYMTEEGLTLESYIEQLKQYTMESPLKITANGKKYSVYYVASQGTTTTLPIPSFEETVEYSVSGNNIDGFIVTVAAHWAADAFDSELPTPNDNPGITLDVTEQTLTVDDALTLHPVFVPLYDSDDKTLIYVSSDPLVATVENGVITALSEGEVTITVKNHNGKYTASCKIKVIGKAPTPNPNPGITLNETALSLKTGDYFQLVATFVPTYDTDNRMLIYSASGSAITIDGTGNIFAREIGTAVITVKNLDGTFSATCTVQVSKGANINAALTLDKSAVTLEEGQSGKISATFIPKYDTDSTVLSYVSSDTAVVTVDQNGAFTAVAPGTAIITVTNQDGAFSAVCTVNVTKKPPTADPDAGITLDKTEIELEVGKTEKITATYKPEYETDNRMLIYSSADPDVVTVNGLGEITAVGPGITTVTVKNINGKYTVTCTVSVPDPNAGITLDKNALTLEEGSSDKLNATFIPLFATDDTTLSFASSDPDTVSIDENGNITAHKYGSVIIIATTANGAFTATCTVTVTEKPDPNAGITLDKTELTLEEGTSDKINAVFVPVFDEDDTTLSFVSSDPEILTVDENGSITAVKPGVVTVTVASADGIFSQTCSVTVTAKTPNPNAGITTESDTVTAEVNGTASVVARFTPAFETDDQTLFYTVADPAIATVDENGTVTGVSAGETVVVIRNADGSFEASCRIIITAIPEPEPVPNPDAGITLSESEITLHLTDAPSKNIIATVVPQFETDDVTLTYESSDPGVASVDEDGTVTAVSAGSAVITVKCGELSALCTVTVTALTISEDTDTGYGDFIPYL